MSALWPRRPPRTTRRTARRALSAAVSSCGSRVPCDIRAASSADPKSLGPSALRPYAHPLLGSKVVTGTTEQDGQATIEHKRQGPVVPHPVPTIIHDGVNIRPLRL